jgi:UDP-N-acetylglucosamine 3-dehydrogenase
MGNPVRVGIVGFGGAGRAHLHRFRANAGVSVTAIFDPNADRASAGLRGIQDSGSIAVTGDWSDFLRRGDLDVVSVCSPDHVHARQAADCLAQGIDVLCEKPMATSVSGALNMEKTAEQAGRRLMVHHQMRYVPVFLKAKQAVDSGALGDVFAIEADYYHDMRERATRFDTWRVDPVQPQSIVYGGACHPLDLMQWVLSDQIVEVFAYASAMAFPEYPGPDTVCSVMKFSRGAVGRLTMTIGCCRPQYNPLVVLGSRGTVVNGLLMQTSGPSRVQHYPPRRSRMKEAAVRWLMSEGSAIHYPFNHYEHEQACRSLVGEFLGSRKAGGPAPVPVGSSVDVIRVCDAMIASYTTGQPVCVVRPA